MEADANTDGTGIFMITILFASYNGEKYIKAQLDSLFAQSVQDFTINIRDDASTDSTVDIIKEYMAKFPDRINLTQNTVNSGSPKYVFLELMQSVRGEYIMLCDQDDVWNADKIEVSLAEIKAVEESCGKHTPVLVFTDLTVTDENLNLISASFKDMMNSDFTKINFNTLLVQNILTGCTAIYNNALACYFTKPPRYCVMHDWWLILTAAAFGKIGVIDKPTLLYRQHGDNNIGAKRTKSLEYKIGRLMDYKDVKRALNETYAQAECFLDTYLDKLSEIDAAMVRRYAEIPRLNKIMKWRVILKYGIMKIGVSRKIAHFIFI